MKIPTARRIGTAVIPTMHGRYLVVELHEAPTRSVRGRRLPFYLVVTVRDAGGIPAGHADHAIALDVRRWKSGRNWSRYAEVLVEEIEARATFVVRGVA